MGSILSILSTTTPQDTFIIAQSKSWRSPSHQNFGLRMFVSSSYIISLGYPSLFQFDTKYYYAVGIGQTVRKFWFMTPPESGPDVPYTFGLIGASQYDEAMTLLIIAEI